MFAAGFALGTIRVLFVIPQLGETNAVLLELPVMLALSWVACRWLVRRFAVPPRVVNRLVMGGVAFAFVMLAELGVSVFGFDRTLPEHFAAYRSIAAQIGLAAQLGFAAFPLVQASFWRTEA
ncbi:MAG: hypothetical protein K8S25_09560 [Alphaproteobacteria bacterium]|nr:hypothetical protein [Alphaproteobacteria bacterium]